METEPDPRTIHLDWDDKCSFCGKVRKEVKQLIHGPDVAICDECVELCVQVLATDPNATD